MTSEYKVVFHPSAVKELSQLDKKICVEIKKAITRLQKAPEKGLVLKGPWKGYRKYRVRSYRIIYKLVKDRLEIFILRIRHRREVYKNLF